MHIMSGGPYQTGARRDLALESPCATVPIKFKMTLLTVKSLLPRQNLKFPNIRISRLSTDIISTTQLGFER